MALFKSNEKRLVNLSVKDIASNVVGSRRNFDDYELFKLSESIRANGMIQPITVRKTERGYLLVSGERRLRAAKRAGLKKVPCIVVNVSGETAAVYSVTENLQRADLNLFEQAESISRLIGDYGISQLEVAAKLGVTQSTLSGKLRILRFLPEEREKIISAKLTERHARALIRIEDVAVRQRALDRILSEYMCAKECEEYVDKILNPESRDSEPLTRCKSGIADVRIFSNSINRLVDTMIAAGIKVNRKKQENKDYIEYRIKILKQKHENGDEDSPQLKIC